MEAGMLSFNPQSEIRNPSGAGPQSLPLLLGVLNFAQAGRMLAGASFRGP